VTLPLFRHLVSHHRIYRMTVGRRGEVAVGREFRTMLRALLRDDVLRSGLGPQDETSVDLSTEFLVGSLWSTVVWWMQTGQALSAEALDRRYREMVLRGLTSARAPAW
jgi:hypothetical protein